MITHKLFIPPLKTQLQLVNDWSFDLYDEYRNYNFWSAYHNSPPKGNNVSTSVVTIPKETIMSIERIYIKRGLGDYDSVTFRILDSPNRNIRKKRFWVKLKYVNQMEVLLIKS